MRVAALYDVHGNLPALEAVLAEVEREGVDEIVVGGDVVWGPFPAECLTVLRAAGAAFVTGNCEREVLKGESEKGRWCRARLSGEERSFVASWPQTIERDIADLGDVLFCHATPRSDTEILTTLTPDKVLAGTFAQVQADVIVCGHTHVQFERPLPRAGRLVNAGSVGLAYEGEPTARWALLGPDVDLRATALDPEPVLAKLHDTGFPEVVEMFDDAMRGGVAAAEASEYFESQRAP